MTNGPGAEFPYRLTKDRNAVGGNHPDSPVWPDAPSDLYMSLGAHGNSSVIIPSLRLVLVCAEGEWGLHEPGNPASPMNRLLKTLAEAAGWRRGPSVTVDGALHRN